MDRTEIDIDSNADVENCAYYDARIVGTLDGNSRLEDCEIGTLNYLKGFVEKCVLTDGTITLGGAEDLQFLDCWQGEGATPEIDCGGSGQSLSMRNYNGKAKIVNKSGTDKVSIDLNSGEIVLANTVTGGSVVCRGVGSLVDENGDHIPSGTWNGCTIVNETTGFMFFELLTMVRNKVVLSGNIATVYMDDETTVWRQFDLSGGGRVPV
jgi:hypothetical protein